MAINVDQATMDDMTQKKANVQQKLTKAQQDVTSAQGQVTSLQKQLDSYTALITGSVVVP